MTKHTLTFSRSDNQGPTRCTSSFGAKLNAIHAGWSIALGGLACLTIWGIQDDLNSSNIDTDPEAISWSFMTVVMLTLLLIMFRFYKNGQWLNSSKASGAQAGTLKTGNQWATLQKSKEPEAVDSTLEGWITKGYHDLKEERISENFWATTAMFFCGDCCTDFHITPDDLVNYLANELMLNQHAPSYGYVLQYFLPEGVNLSSQQESSLASRLSGAATSTKTTVKANTQPAISEATHPSTSRAEFFFNEDKTKSCCKTLVTAALKHKGYLEASTNETTEKNWQDACEKLFTECGLPAKEKKYSITPETKNQVNSLLDCVSHISSEEALPTHRNSFDTPNPTSAPVGLRAK